jgi:hypothetical protein
MWPLDSLSAAVYWDSGSRRCGRAGARRAAGRQAARGAPERGARARRARQAAGGGRPAARQRGAGGPGWHSKGHAASLDKCWRKRAPGARGAPAGSAGQGATGGLNRPHWQRGRPGSERAKGTSSIEMQRGRPPWARGDVKARTGGRGWPSKARRAPIQGGAEAMGVQGCRQRPRRGGPLRPRGPPARPRKCSHANAGARIQGCHAGSPQRQALGRGWIETLGAYLDGAPRGLACRSGQSIVMSLPALTRAAAPREGAARRGAPRGTRGTRGACGQKIGDAMASAGVRALQNGCRAYRQTGEGSLLVKTSPRVWGQRMAQAQSGARGGARQRQTGAPGARHARAGAGAGSGVCKRRSEGGSQGEAGSLAEQGPGSSRVVCAAPGGACASNAVSRLREGAARSGRGALGA